MRIMSYQQQMMHRQPQLQPYENHNLQQNQNLQQAQSENRR